MADDEKAADPGWYPAGDVLRYWDGEKWTDHTAPLTPPEMADEPVTDKRAEKQAKRDAKQAERQAKQAELRAKLDESKEQRAASKSGDARPDIAAAVAKMSQKVGSKREIKRLPEHLWPDETVDLLASGAYGPGTGVLVLTDRRLLFLKDGVAAKVSEDFPLEKVSSVQWQTGMMMGAITIFASGNKAEIKNVPKPDGKALTDAVRARLAGLGRDEGGSTESGIASPGTEPPAAAAPDPHERLRRLAELHRDGILTDEEFNAKKRQLLDEL